MSAFNVTIGKSYNLCNTSMDCAPTTQFNCVMPYNSTLTASMYCGIPYAPNYTSYYTDCYGTSDCECIPKQNINGGIIQLNLIGANCGLCIKETEVNQFYYNHTALTNATCGSSATTAVTTAVTTVATTVSNITNTLSSTAAYTCNCICSAARSLNPMMDMYLTTTGIILISFRNLSKNLD